MTIIGACIQAIIWNWKKELKQSELNVHVVLDFQDYEVINNSSCPIMLTFR